jgi:hypothetical protein
MNITITIYYKDFGANLIKARELMENINLLAVEAELISNSDNWKHELSHSYFHQTLRSTRKKAEKFAEKVGKIKNVKNISLEIED